jgi:hypothetical protein
MVAERGERSGREDDRRTSGRLSEDPAAQLGQRPPELQLPERVGRPGGDRDAERERIEPAADPRVEIVELLDLRLELVCEGGKKKPRAVRGSSLSAG